MATLRLFIATLTLALVLCGAVYSAGEGGEDSNASVSGAIAAGSASAGGR